jgi:hypothetical protein
MSSIAKSFRLIDHVVRLRRVERIPQAAPDAGPARRELESSLGSTLSRSRAAHVLGVSQTALDRWVEAGRVPVVITPRGRRQVPLPFVIEMREAIDALGRAGRRRHLLAAALDERRRAAAELELSAAEGPDRSAAPRGHGTAERRARAYHAVVAERLDERLVGDALGRVERLAAEGHLHPRYAERWRGLLGRPIAEIAAAISADTQEARDLRQNSPFAGLLNEQERRRIIEATG